MRSRALFALLAWASPLLGQREDGPLAQKLIELHQQPSTAALRARSPLPADPARVVHYVRPRDADPAVTQFLQDHYAMLYRPVAKNGHLFLFFPGTFGRPQNTQLVLDTAARSGYLALGLEYVNTTRDAGRASVGSLCAGSRDLACAGQVRHERMFGEDTSPLVEVAQADAIVTRVEKALAHLSREFPKEGWGRFLSSDGRVRWELVAAAGHSQGAGMAAYLAKKFALARVCLLSGTGDFSRPAWAYASWLKGESATPADRFYAMAHEKESGYRAIMGGYQVLGLDKAHILTVSLPPAQGGALGGSEHGSTATDAATPKNADGSPAYRSQWEFLIGGKDLK
jgi:hypothetical protein